jgi:hypothetical protein
MRALLLALTVVLLCAAACRSAAPSQSVDTSTPRDARVERFEELRRQWTRAVDELCAEADAARVAEMSGQPHTAVPLGMIEVDARPELAAIYAECESLAPDVPEALQFCIDAPGERPFMPQAFARRSGPMALWKAVRAAPASESVERCLWKLWNGSDPDGDRRYPYLSHLSGMKDLPRDSLARGWARLAKAVWVHSIGAADFTLRDHKLTLDALGALEFDYPGTSVAEHARALRHVVESLDAGTAAPELPLVDLAGRSMNLADQRGHCALLVFWDPKDSCTARVLQRIQQLTTPIDLFGVQVGGDAADVARLTQGSRMTWRNAIVAEGSKALLASWGVRALPANFLIDAQGRLRAIDLYGEALNRAVRELQAGRFASTRER